MMTTPTPPKPFLVYSSMNDVDLVEVLRQTYVAQVDAVVAANRLRIVREIAEVHGLPVDDVFNIIFY